MFQLTIVIIIIIIWFYYYKYMYNVQINSEPQLCVNFAVSNKLIGRIIFVLTERADELVRNEPLKWKRIQVNACSWHYIAKLCNNSIR